MPTSSSGCGCHGTRTGARTPLAATLPVSALDKSVTLGGAVPPMEMLGGGGGVTVIDPASVLTRLWWFDGRFLRAEGFRVDQEYVRSLVSLSNQAVGSGVVHGFDADLVGSATLRVEGGLALAPSGGVVHLPSTTDLRIAELVARSTGRFEPAAATGDKAVGGSRDFAPCPPDNPTGPDQAVTPMALYVLTVASAEALCGEEGRFGQLCGDACADDADRSVAVEGVRFRVRPITLGLPTSDRIPFSSLHLRSRVASAYYAAERQAVASMISGAGLRRTVWCDGAEPIGGDEVALAVLDRAGGLTTFVDGWTARRELVETSPQRYWQWRTAMRPLDVFLAQVLQFQCQLADVPAAGWSMPESDPCAPERTVLGHVHALLDDLGDGPRRSESVLDKLQELRGRVTEVLAGTRPSPSGSLMIDHGIVETPSAGYLPVDPRQDVRAQVVAWFGPGVDLRFCAVRPDFVPEAFAEAQHMERISLTRGVDDPQALEEVDVLVPGGTFTRVSTDQAFTGRLDLLPMLVGDDLASVESAALSLEAVARNQVAAGWSWTLAGYGELPHRLGMEEYARAMRTAVTASEDDPVEVHRESVATLRGYRADAALRILREGNLARARAGRVFESGHGAVATPNVTDHAIQPDERRPMVAWADVETARPLDELEIGATTSLRVRLATYSRAKRPSINDLVLTGSLAVTDRRVEPVAAGGTIVRMVTTLDGSLEVVTEDDGGSGPHDLRGSSVVWRTGRTATGLQLLGVELSLVVDQHDRPLTLSANFGEQGTPRQVEGRVVRGKDAGFQVAMVENTAPRTPVAVVSLREEEGVLALGTPGRDLATSVIDVLGTALAAVGRGAGFSEQARRRLLPESQGTEAVSAQGDWVMFHRRRTKECGGTPETPPPTRLLRYRWLHSVVASPDDVDPGRQPAHALSQPAEALSRLLKRYPPQPVGMVEFEEGSTAIHSSVPALREAWSATDRGARMPLAVTGRWGTGEGSAVEGGRLDVAVAAVSGQIDTTGIRSFVLAEAPPELQSEGTDGVFVTFGVPDEVVRSSSQVVGMNFDQRERVRSVLPNISHVDELMRVLQDLGVETFGLEFLGDDLENAEDLRQWWGGRTVKQVELLYDRQVPPGSEAAIRWAEHKYPKIADALGPSPDPEEIPDVSIDLAGAEVLVIVSTPEG